jgi:hypothetical protein
MSSKDLDKFTKEEAAKRDALLLKMLKTPPQPRPKREREGSVSPKGGKGKKTPTR